MMMAILIAIPRPIISLSSSILNDVYVDMYLYFGVILYAAIGASPQPCTLDTLIIPSEAQLSHVTMNVISDSELHVGDVYPSE